MSTLLAQAKKNNSFGGFFSAIINKPPAELKRAQTVLGSLTRQLVSCQLPQQMLGASAPPNAALEGFTHIVTTGPAFFVFEDDLANEVQEALECLAESGVDSINAFIFKMHPFNTVAEAYFLGRMKLQSIDHSLLTYVSNKAVTKTLTAIPAYVQHARFSCGAQPTIDELLSKI